MDAVTDGLGAATGPGSFAVTEAALRLAFGPQRLAELPAFADLTSPQQRLVRTLARLGDNTWNWYNFLEILRSWGMPRTHADMCAYAGVPVA